MIKENRIAWVVAALIVALAAYFGFDALYAANISEYAKEFISGCLGALITIAATAALLRTQTQGEIVKNYTSGIFVEKARLYSDFIIYINSVHKDGRVSKAEFNSLIEWALRVSLVSNAYVVGSIYEYLFQIFAFDADQYRDLSEEALPAWKQWHKQEVTEFAFDKEYDDPDFCIAHFTTLASVVTALRDDLVHKSLTTDEETVKILAEVERILELRHATEVEIDEDNGISITIDTRPTRRRKASKT